MDRLIKCLTLLLIVDSLSASWTIGTSCGDPPDVAYGAISLGSSTIGTYRTLSCKTGYHLHGSDVVQCLSDGHWKIDGHCSEIGHCGPVPQILNGMISEGQSIIGAVRTFSCMGGYMVNGSSILQCTHDRKWHIDGNCVADSCTSSPFIENGRVLGGSSKIGSTRRVVCHNGFGLSGHDTITCSHDRNWMVHTSCIPVKFAQDLLDAAAKGDVYAVQRMIQQGADINGKDGDGMTPLLKAAQNGQTSACQVLIERGANVNARNKLQQTPLILASELGHANIVDILLGHGADVDARDEDGDSALIVATWDGHLRVVRRLLDYRAEVNYRNQDGRTALSYANENSRLAEIAQLLKSRGAIP